MSPRLMFPDPLAAVDVLTFSGRAAALGDGNVRLKAANGVLVLSSAPLAPKTLLDTTPTVLGMRAVEVDAELVCDLVVDAADLAADAGDSRAIALPETARTAPWAGISAPTGGWTRVGTLPASVLAARAQWGIAAVADIRVDHPAPVHSRHPGRYDAELPAVPEFVCYANAARRRAGRH
ncbi:MAG: hypothetical protein J0H70_12210, partial [Microbacterium chocolatum]|nr:hypothetical protein [Microbacterium chocolatum]